jgi:hypothetical protein
LKVASEAGLRNRDYRRAPSPNRAATIGMLLNPLLEVAITLQALPD